METSENTWIVSSLSVACTFTLRVPATANELELLKSDRRTNAGIQVNVLDLAARLDIAIDVAHAITYLHMYTGMFLVMSQFILSCKKLTSCFDFESFIVRRISF